ncbi:hypothetical protein NEOLEDRAFT_1074874 [Neolentinus lepideus HHB14362 ss-1]|uniref:C3H1-type domain-containing protein n=1 Tax=Neolentinus lepideus HHB14362 ss-1 TaxID=1314782 RepID=A0A165PC47_9AGAM|nr:hypothetical protein NEOLEDRAFT_1074874 [Neolentinus lepideus HHB14362 ss-1]
MTADDTVNQPPIALNNEVSTKCNEVVEEYRAGTASKVDAILRLQSIIPRSDDTEDQFKSALQSYVGMLDSADQARASAAKRGEQRQPRSPPESDDEDASEKPAKRSIDESRLPWVIDELLHPIELPPSLRLTRESLQLWSSNPKQYKASLTNAARCPEFPDSEWSNIIESKPINLDIVFAGHYSTSFDNRRTEKLGELELTFGETKPSKRIESAGDWLIAWTKASEALQFAFPHRERELREYGSYVTQLFGAVHPSRHHRVLQYEKAIRRRVSARRDLSLTDFSRFADLHLLHIDSSGAVALDEDSRPQARPNRGGDSRKRPGKGVEACHRWNEGRCPVDAARCCYTHICSTCRSREHTAEQCTNRARAN